MLEFIIWDWNPAIIESPIAVRWYGLMFAIGFIVGYWILSKIFKHEGACESWLGTLLLWVVGGTIIGARLGHVFFYEWDKYSQNPIEILYIWEGGLASHGGTIALFIAVLLFSHFTTKRSPLWTFDRLVIPTALVAGLIRLGNLFNSEIYGHATDLPWGFKFVNDPYWRYYYEGQAAHPTQIYEALCYFALFGLLMWLYWKKDAEKRPGLIFGLFFTILFSCRFLIEFVKNNQVDFEEGMTLNMGQWLSVPFILGGIYLIIRAMRRPAVELSFPNKFADEPEQTKKKR